MMFASFNFRYFFVAVLFFSNLIAALQVTDYRVLRSTLRYQQLTMDQPMCRNIAITDDLKVEEEEQFRVSLFPSRSIFGVDVLLSPRRSTVTIIDDAPSKYIS